MRPNKTLVAWAAFTLSPVAAILLPPPFTGVDVDTPTLRPSDMADTAQTSPARRPFWHDGLVLQTMYRQILWPDSGDTQTGGVLGFMITIDDAANALVIDGTQVYTKDDVMSVSGVLEGVDFLGRGRGKHYAKLLQQPVSYTLDAVEGQSDDPSTQMISITMHIDKVGGRDSPHARSLEIALIRYPDGHLRLVLPDSQLRLIPTDPRASHLPDGNSDSFPKNRPGVCMDRRCRWFTAMAQWCKSWTSGVRSKYRCGGMQASHHGHAQNGGVGGHHHHHNQEDGISFHKMHQLRMHSWSQLNRKLVTHILLPMLGGLAAGVSISLLGMLVGTALIGMWRRLFRHRFQWCSCHHNRRQSTSKTMVQVEQGADEEKACLMAQDALAEETESV